MKILFFVLLFIVLPIFGYSFDLFFKPTAVGALYYPKDDLKADFYLAGEDKPNSSVKVSLKFYDPYGNELYSNLKTMEFVENQDTLTVDLPYYIGYVKILATVDSGKEYTFSYAIIPPNYQDFKDVDSPFGVNCHFNQGWDPYVGKIVKRVGIEYVRDGEARPEDLSAPVCIENKLCYMPCFTHIATPSWEYMTQEREKGKTAFDKWDFKGYLDDYANFAERWGDYVDYYDIANEPPNVPNWNAFGGSWYGGEWTNLFLQWGEQVAKNIRKYDKDAKIVWEDCGPQLWLRQFIKEGLNPKYIDAISPHPYNLHRNLPLPEDTETIEDYALTALWLKENNFKNLPFIIGELGVSSFQKNENYNEDGFYSSVTELEQAEQVVRHLATAFARGVKKFFYYDFKNDFPESYNPEGNFGLINMDFTPKPSVVAYANFIARTRGCEWLGRYTCGAGCYAYAYKQPGAETGSVIIWSKNGDKTTQLFHCDNCPDTLITYDIFGNKCETIKKEMGNIFNVHATQTPQYIDNIPLEDLKWTVYKQAYLTE